MTRINLKSAVAEIARKITGPVLFQKSLPEAFGQQKIWVTSRSDLRLLYPGFKQSSQDLLTIAQTYVKTGATIWDIGSNLGIFTFCSAMATGKNGRVYSLEADSRYADIQSRSQEQLNQKAGQVIILCAAAADRAGILQLNRPKKGHSRNHLEIVQGNDAGATESQKQVVTLTLDWLLEYWEKPDFVKIDVEGAELLTIQGSIHLFEQIRPMAYIECAPENTHEMTRFFKKRGYHLYRIDEAGNETEVDSFCFNTLVKPEEVMQA